MRKKIAVLVGQPEETYQTVFLEGLLTRAFSENFDVCIFAMFMKHQKSKGREWGEANIFSLPDYNFFEAVIVLANTIQTPGVLERIEETLHEKCKKPVIFVDRESKYFYSVSADNDGPVKRMISHLIEEHGYTDIAFLTGNEHHPHARARLKSFLECMHEHGLETPDNRIFYGDFWYNSGTTAAEKLLLDREHLPQAVACANDFMALGLITELERSGLRIPQDIAVTGYDASMAGRRAKVPVTSVPIPAREIGMHCLDYVKAVSEGKEVPEFVTPTELFLGSSCGCSGEVEDSTFERENWETYKPPHFETNLGVMEDEMLVQTEALGLMNTIFLYVYQIRPFEGFHLCLNEEWADEDFEREPGKEYTGKMVDVLRCGVAGRGKSRVDLSAVFDRRILLPELTEDDGPARAYYFSPLFFGEHCFGYAAVNYGETIRCYGEAYRMWLDAVMRGLESFLRVGVLKARNARLETGQVRDALTGLYNYKGLLEHMTAVLAEMEDSSGWVDITVIELLGLNEVYMNIGSRDGDRVVVDFSQMLVLSGSWELLCYLGSGEFLLCSISQDEIQEEQESRLEDVRQKLEQYCHSLGLDGKVEIAVGSMLGTVSGEESLGSLIGEAVSCKNANKIREQRKKQKGMTKEERKMAEIVADILDNNRLMYFFQPIVDARNGEIYAYEALMRANVKEKISPLDILKCAEYLGRLNDVERATFFNVLSFVEENKELFEEKKIFINSIPGTQMEEKDAEVIRQKMTHLTGQIVVELTEQAELDDEQLEALKNKYERLGVDTAIDDYGTGYSNVYNLLRYMPKVVKIDRMLLANIQLSAQKQHFVKEITEFSHNNGITVLAEGVETAEELKMVASIGADLIQGYYTARPQAEVIQRIDREIRNEIVQCSQYVQEKNQRKVFRAGQDVEISLIKLATGHYSKIRFTQEDVPHRDVAIVGLQGFQASMEIDIEDGYCGRIEMKDVDLAMRNEQPAIRIGKNCDVTLVLTGENIFEQGGILVPETSKLTVQGDGNLKIQQIAVNGYGIGAGKDEKCGELCFEQDGRIEISGNTVHGVGIGAGSGGSIRINSGAYSLQLAGKEAIGIGVLDGDVDLCIQSCAIELNLRNSISVGIGSIRGNAVTKFCSANVKGVFNASKCVCIGTMEGSSEKFELSDGVVEIHVRSEYACGIGSFDGDTELSAVRFSASIRAEGNHAVALGNHSKTARVFARNGELMVHVESQQGSDVGAEVFEMVNGYGEFILNGEQIARGSTSGDA